eukprot:11256500-Karenia_brevis.AAC.1
MAEAWQEFEKVLAEAWREFAQLRWQDVVQAVHRQHDAQPRGETFQRPENTRRHQEIEKPEEPS